MKRVIERPTAGIPRYFAILVGVASYDDPGIPDVPNATRDIKAVRAWLAKFGQVREGDVLVLTDGGAEAPEAGTLPTAPLAPTLANLDFTVPYQPRAPHVSPLHE